MKCRDARPGDGERVSASGRARRRPGEELHPLAVELDGEPAAGAGGARLLRGRARDPHRAQGDLEEGRLQVVVEVDEDSAPLLGVAAVAVDDEVLVPVE